MQTPACVRQADLEQRAVLVLGPGRGVRKPWGPELRRENGPSASRSISGGKRPKTPCVLLFLSFWFSPAGQTEGHPQEKQREGEASFLGQIYGVLDAACGCQAKMARVG